MGVLGRRKAFDAKNAIELIVSTAARVGNSVELSSVLVSLRAAFPGLQMSDTALKRELRRAADHARVLTGGYQSLHPASLISTLEPSNGRTIGEGSLAA
jgi:hypothetical protein